MRLLVECTYVYDHPKDNSGIQRVVRNIISKLGNTKEIADAVPVILKNNKIYEVKKLCPDSISMYHANRLHSKLIQLRERYWLAYHRIEKLKPFNVSLNMRKGLHLMFKQLCFCFDLPIVIVSRLYQRGEIGKRIIELLVKPDDILVLLDSSWHSDCFSQVEEFKSKGVTIVSVIYDLIPLTHPEFCHEGLVVVFQRWFEWVGRTADGFMAISKTIRDQAANYVHQGIAGAEPQNHQWFDYFHLGSELDLSVKNSIVRKHVKKVFQNNHPVYLMVGTIEPRKNHDYLIDAFNLLWKNGLDVNLCFVGKVGWKCQALIERVKTHTAYGRRLFMFNDLSDAELEYCYSKSRSLVFPAYVEGFGLPLVEAMQRGLPAMASNIPVFREVGGDFIAYFDLEKPETLTNLVQHFEACGLFPGVKKVEEWSWLNWEDSTKQFLSRILSHVTSPYKEANKKLLI